MISIFVLGFERTYSGDINVVLDRDWLKFGDVIWYANAKYTVLSNDGPITEIEGRNVHGTSYKLDQSHVLPVTGEYFVFQSNLPKLVKIDPNNPPEYKKQMLFYNSEYNLFRLGQVRCIQEDENGRSIVYNHFDEVKLVDNTTFQRYIVPFYPTHYLNIDLDEFAKTVKNKIKLVKVDTYRDGGTTKWVAQDDYEKLKNPKEIFNIKYYYLDNRMATDTKGCLLDAYPGSNANVLDITLFDFT